MRASQRHCGGSDRLIKHGRIAEHWRGASRRRGRDGGVHRHAESPPNAGGRGLAASAGRAETRESQGVSARVCTAFPHLCRLQPPPAASAVLRPATLLGLAPHTPCSPCRSYQRAYRSRAACGPGACSGCRPPAAAVSVAAAAGGLRRLQAVKTAAAPHPASLACLLQASTWMATC